MNQKKKNSTSIFLVLSLLFAFTGLQEVAFSQVKASTRPTPRRKGVVEKPKVLSKEDSLSVNYKEDTTINKGGRRPVYRWKDRQTNRYVEPQAHSPLLMKDAKVVKNDYKLDPATKTIGVYEKIGTYQYRSPQDLSFNQYSSIQNRLVRQNLLREYAQSSDGKSAVSGRGLKPLISKSKIADKIFGGDGEAMFKPNGSVEIFMKLQNSYIDNPSMSQANSRQKGFQFNQVTKFNVNGKVGDKLGLITNYDTQSTFNFENQLRLNYKSDPENILQKFEAGNVTLPLQSQLIPGVQNLFGVKTTLKFGKTDVQIVAAQQRSKTETIILKAGQQNKGFEVRCDTYDENRHFFLSQFFRENYERSLKNLPLITSGVRVTRIEVYITNRSSSYETQRNVVGFADLGEANPHSATIKKGTLNVADNTASNDLFAKLKDKKAFRTVDQTNSVLSSDLNLKKNEDYELLRGAKRLTDRDFRFNPDLGYISLLSQLRNDEVLAVAYEYTYNGQNYKVGEMMEDYTSLTEDQVVVLKLLKSSTMRNRLDLPMWNLMMKNVYSLPTAGINRIGFQLRLIYKDDQTGMDTPSLQEGKSTKDVPLVQMFNLDKLNSQNDPQPDGNFDFVEGVTIDSKNGKVYFPTLEPFGKSLEKFFAADEAILKDKYIFNELYRSTLTDAQQITTKNKFFLRGNYQSGGVNDVQLPLGVDPKSVRVMAGGNSLMEGSDFQVDGQSGRLRITNPAVLSSAREVRIEYEKPEIFMNQSRSLYGTRIDHNLSKDIHIGFTAMMMRESPPSFTTRVPIGQEPVNNSIIGADLTLKKDARWLTRMLDALPFVQTKEMSVIQIQGEYAHLFSGVSPKIKDFADNSVMIDEFEAARNTYDLARQPSRWRLGSTPENILGNGIRRDSIASGYKRAKMSVYRMDDTFYNNGSGLGFTQNSAAGEGDNNLYERRFNMQDIFVNRSNTQFANFAPLINIDFAYFPKERGMYNYNPDLDANGLLKNPKQNYGAVMRAVSADNDFDNSNIELIEFWMLNPFKDVVRDGIVNARNLTGGKLKIQLGDISEDVIPDEQNNFENGLPTDSLKEGKNYRKTKWGRAPKTQFLIDAFSNTTGSRAKQDVGLEGLSNEDEAKQAHIADFIKKVNAITGITQAAKDKILKDPSADDFRFYLDPSFPTSVDLGLLRRYKDYLGMESNSPINEKVNNQSGTGDNFTQASTLQPDKEDLNIDNTINDNEAFYEYDIDLKVNSLDLNKGYVVDKVEKNGAEWLLFRVPIRGYTRKVGDINGFKSIRFVRMVMTEWEQPVVIRMASFQLVGNSYRVYDKDLDSRGLTEVLEPYDAQFKVGVINIEENGCEDSPDGTSSNCDLKGAKTPYVIPPGFIRDRDVSSQYPVFFNEQSMTLSVKNLRDNDSRAAFKNGNYNLTNYEDLRMFIHLERENVNNTDTVAAFLRLGTDLSDNYYEIEVSNLKSSPTFDKLTKAVNLKAKEAQANEVWQKENRINVPIKELVNIKSLRNRQTNRELSRPFKKLYTRDYTEANGTSTKLTYTISVVGNPDLSSVQTLMIGVRNPKDKNELAQSFTIWVDELRVSGFRKNEGKEGNAAIGTASIKLADLGNVVMNGNWRTFGFGGVQERLNQRAREETKEWGLTSNLELDKFLPQKWNLKIPLYVTYDNSSITPHFNPLDPDMPLSDALNDIYNPTDNERNKGITIAEIKLLEKKRSFFEDSIAVEKMNRYGFNFTNVRKVRSEEDTKQHFYDIENFTASYAQNEQKRSSSLIEEYNSKNYKGGLSYNYTFSPKTFEPFAKSTKLNKPRYLWLKDFNIAPMPTVVAFRTDFDRMATKTQFRNSDLTTLGIIPNFEKYFLLNRFYDAQWNLTKSIMVNYTGTMNAIVDEPYGEDSHVLGNQNTLVFRSDSILNNLKRLGRAKLFDQKLTATYQIPLEKLYIMDWLQAQAVANTGFKYQASSFGLKDEKDQLFGNVINNNRDFGLQGRVDLVKLYNKIRYLKFANTPPPPRKNFARSPGDDEELEKPKNETLRNFTRLLMAVRGIQFNTGITETTTLPGFMPSPQILGTRLGFGNETAAPGLGFSMLGKQYRDNTGNQSFLDNAAKNNWLSTSIYQPLPFVQTRVKKFDFSTNIEPVKDLKLQIRGMINRGDNYQEIFRIDESGKYSTSTPVRSGQFSMSFWSFKTSFVQFKDAFKNRQEKQDSLGSILFDNLLQYRKFFADKLIEGRVSEKGKYDLNSQDVLIPAFFAAYTGKNPENLKVGSAKSFNPFLKFPMPNWRLDYGKLAELKPFKKYFTSITLSHSYSSTYSVGSFTSSLGYGGADQRRLDLATNGYPTATEINNGLYIPVYMMNGITMQEKFAPFIGIQFMTKKNISGRLNYNQERNITLNTSSSIIAEDFNRDFDFNFSYKKNKMKLPFRINGETITLKNDVNVSLGWIIRDGARLIRKLEDGTSLITKGDFSNNFNYTVDYQFNKNVKAAFFIIYDKYIPKSSLAYLKTQREIGINLTFNLAYLDAKN